MRDFNLSPLKWNKDGVLKGYVKLRDLVFYHCFNETGVTQWVKKENLLTLVIFYN